MNKFPTQALKLSQQIDATLSKYLFHYEMLEVAIEECSLMGTIYGKTEMEESKAKMKGLMRRLDRMCGEVKQGSITDADIQAAKEYPIEDLIESVRGWAKCPFHTDKTASLHLKNNKAYCYGACKETFNPIDFLMKRDGISFTEAVKRLI